MAKKKSTSTPKAPAPRNLDSELGSITALSSQVFPQQSAQLAQQAVTQAANQATLNQQIIDQSMAATDAIAQRLDNSYTASSLGAVDESMGNMRQMGQYADRLGGLGLQAQADLAGTNIEHQLQSQAEQDLALGRSLSPEQIRVSQQAARAGASARGLGTGTQSAVAEILNRDAYATARQDARRSFAGATNQLVEGNRQNRMTLAGNFSNQAAGVRQNMSAIGLSGAAAYLNADPYARALGSNIPTAGIAASSAMSGQIASLGIQGNQQTQQQLMSYGNDLYNTNFNAGWNNYLNTQNNNAAKKQSDATVGAANKSASATSATTAATAGSAALTAAAVCWLAREAFGEGSAEWRVFRAWLLRRAPEGLLRWYAGNGRAAACWLREHAWCKPAVRGVMRMAMA